MNQLTKEQIEYIRNNYLSKTYLQLSKELKIKESTVKYIIQEMGLIKQSHKPWTKEELEFLVVNFENLTSEEMGKILNRSIPSINGKRKELGLWIGKPWTNKDINFLKNHYLDMTHKEIAKHLNRTKQAITAKCFELDLYKKEPRWIKKDLDFLRNNYSVLSTKEIAEFLNRSCNAIKLKAERIGLKKSPYICNYHYFDEINSEEKAYWLGFLSADGWISLNEKSGSGTIGMELQIGDINHLRKFNKSINGNYKIYDRWRECSFSHKQRHTCVIRIFSVIMYKSLQVLGFTSDKSYNTYIPKLRDDLYRHFLRGFFDGDGCFCLSNKSFSVGFITASETMCDDIIKICESIGININTTSYISDYGTKMFRPNVYRKDEKIKLLDYMYNDANIYLDRKYKKYLKAKKKHDPNNGLAA